MKGLGASHAGENPGEDERLLVRYGFWIIAAVVVVLDQVTKSWALSTLALGEPMRAFIPGLISLELVYNLGVAFGQLQNAGSVLVFAAFGASAAILYYRTRILRRFGGVPPLLEIGLALALGGAVGNMIDRARLGHVVDFLVLGFWPQFPRFNIADTAITVSAVLLAAYFLFVSDPEGEAEPEACVSACEAGNEQGV